LFVVLHVAFALFNPPVGKITLYKSSVTAESLMTGALSAGFSVAGEKRFAELLAPEIQKLVRP
jgi:hypothetical protein